MRLLKPLALIFTVTAMIGGIAYFYSPFRPIEESANIFASEIYPHYHEQLKAFVQQHPHYEKFKDTPLVALLEQPLGSPAQKRATHKEMVLQLRSGLATHNNEQQREFLDDIIRWMYLQVDLNDTLQTYLYRYIEPPKDNISTYLQLAQSVLHNDRRFNKMSFTLRSDDALLHGNLPSVYATLPTKVIRCGKPVIDAPLWFTPKISPEFRRFVQLQPRHLYVNLMKRHGSEGPGTQALEHLEKEISEFSVITLDKNSDFYQQRGLDPQKKQASDLFKMKFLENMTREKGNYYWSENLDRNDWTKELAHILDEVHVRHFSSKEELDVEERLDFIELTYVAIIDRLLERLRPASMNISCRHGMDRGPSLLVLWLLQKGQLDDQALAALLLTPPLIIHNRSSHAHRISRFVSASKRML